MRTNIDVNEELLRRAMEASHATTKKATVEAALRLTIQLKNQEKILDLFGKVQWDGDLDAMRASRFQDWGEERVAQDQTSEAHKHLQDAGFLDPLVQTKAEV